MKSQGAMVVDWTREELPAVGLVPACVRWTAGLGFRRVVVTAWGSEASASVEGIAETGDRRAFPARPRTALEARAEGEAWLYG